MTYNQEPNLNSSYDAPGMERIVFFSDAVMAIAITLLAIDLKVPELPVKSSAELLAILQQLSPRFISFIISFAVIGVYWSSHHRYFGYIKRYNRTLVALNLLFLLFIVSMPFVTSFLGLYGYLPLGVTVYALVVAGTGLSIAAIWWYAAADHRLVESNLDDRFIHNRRLVALLGPAAFLISIPFAYLNPRFAILIWWAAPFISVAALRTLDRRKINPGRADIEQAGEQ